MIRCQAERKGCTVTTERVPRTARRLLRWAAAVIVGVVAATTLSVAPASAGISFFKIQNAWSSWRLESRTVPHATVFMNDHNNFTTQIWGLSPVTSTPENDYTISTYDRGWCLDQHYSTSGPTNLLRAWDCTGVPNQRWIITAGAHGNVLVNARSRWCLDQSDNGAGSPSATVVAWPNCHLQTNQFWLFYGI
jgi:hypothetical protein